MFSTNILLCMYVSKKVSTFVKVFILARSHGLVQGFPTFSSPRTTKWAEKFLRTTKAIIVSVAYHLKHSMLQFHI